MHTQLYSRRSKFIKGKDEETMWKALSYEYMTEESEGDEVILKHPLSWRSHSMFAKTTLQVLIMFPL